MEQHKLTEILNSYQESFSEVRHNKENLDYDLLMDVFGISPALKAENKQYWGRELGKCLEKIIKAYMNTHPLYSDPIKEDSGREPYDFQFDNLAIDTKYRIGSGDSGTIKKWKDNAEDIRGLGLVPVFLVMRQDNLLSPINALLSAGWKIYTGDDFYKFSKEILDFDIETYLKLNHKKFQFLNLNQ